MVNNLNMHHYLEKTVMPIEESRQYIENIQINTFKMSLVDLH
jgi:hypothetical protein